MSCAREGSVSSARKGSRLPALEGLEPSDSAGSILSKATPPWLLESGNKQKSYGLYSCSLFILAGIVEACIVTACIVRPVYLYPM